MRPFSSDLRQRVLAAALSGELTQIEAAERFSVSLSFVEKLLRRYRATGRITPRPHGGGRRRAVTSRHEPVLLALIEVDNDATDAEIAERFTAEAGCSVSPRTINRTWQRLGITRKKRRYEPASERAPTSLPSARPSGS